MTVSKEEVLQTLCSFHAHVMQCDRTILEICKTIAQMEKTRIDAEQIMKATFHTTWNAGAAAGKQTVLRDVPAIYEASMESSRREIRDLQRLLAWQAHKKEMICSIWSCFLALPEKERQVLSLLYEGQSKQETYAAKMERAMEATGFSRAHIARLARQGIQRIQEACEEKNGTTRKPPVKGRPNETK